MGLAGAGGCYSLCSGEQAGVRAKTLQKLLLLLSGRERDRQKIDARPLCPTGCSEIDTYETLSLSIGM